MSVRPYDNVPLFAQQDLEWDGQGPNVASLNGVIDNLQRQILLGGGGGGGGGGGSGEWITIPSLVGDGGPDSPTPTDNHDACNEIVAALNANKVVTVLTPGVYQYSGRWDDITGDGTLICGPGVIFEANQLAATSIHIFGGKSQWYGGEFRNRKYRHYRVIEVAKPSPLDGFSAVLTLDLDDPETGTYGGPHDFLFNEAVSTPWIVNESGSSFNTNFSRITNIDPDGIHITIRQIVAGVPVAAVPSVTHTYPINPLDGSGRQVWPEIYRIRVTAALSDIFALRMCSASFYGVHARWTNVVGFLAEQPWSNACMIGCKVSETGADGVHVINGSNLWIDRNTFQNVADDHIALLSHTGNSTRPRTRNIWVTRNLLDTGRARGIALNGVADSLISDNLIKNILAAGIYMSAEQGFYGALDITLHNNTIQTCGSAGAVYTGWSTLVQPAVMFFPQSTTRRHAMVSRIKFTGTTRIWNARGAAFGGVTTATVMGMTIDELEIVESGGQGWSGFAFADVECKRLRVSRSGGHSMSVLVQGTGVNTWERVDIWDPNRGFRRYAKSMVVAGAILTVTLEDNVINTFGAGNVVIVAGVNSDYTGATGATSDAEVTADETINSYAAEGFQITGTYTVISVSGQDVVMDRTNMLLPPLLDTNHVGVIKDDQPCPQAYIALLSGSAAGNDGINIDAIPTTDTASPGVLHTIQKAILRSANYTFDNFIETTAAAWRSVYIANPIDMTGTKAITQAPGVTTPRLNLGASNLMTLDSPGGTVITADLWGRGSAITRTGLTSIANDQTADADDIVAVLRLPVGARMTVSLINASGYGWGFTGGANVTISGFSLVPPLMEVEAQLYHVTLGNLTLTLMNKERDLSKLTSYRRVSYDSTDGNITMNTELMSGQVYMRTNMTANRLTQLPTAANLYLSVGAVPGFQYVFEVWNSVVGFDTTVTNATDLSWFLNGSMLVTGVSKATFIILFIGPTSASITRAP